MVLGLVFLFIRFTIKIALNVDEIIGRHPTGLGVNSLRGGIFLGIGSTRCVCGRKGTMLSINTMVSFISRSSNSLTLSSEGANN